MTPAERAKVNKKVVFFAGKAAPGYYVAKLVRPLLPLLREPADRLARGRRSG